MGLWEKIWGLVAFVQVPFTALRSSAASIQDGIPSLEGQRSDCDASRYAFPLPRE